MEFAIFNDDMGHYLVIVKREGRPAWEVYAPDMGTLKNAQDFVNFKTEEYKTRTEKE